MEETRYFQWIAGDRRGEVLVLEEIVEDDGEVYLSFKDESRINVEFVAELNQTDLSQKMMAEVDSPTNVWTFKERESATDKKRIEQDWESQTKYEIPSADEIASADLTSEGGMTRPNPKKKKQIDLIPPRKTPKMKTKFGTATTSVPQHQPQPEQSTVNTGDPVYIMMEKAKKFDTDIPMELTISLPAKSLYDVAKESFEDGGNKVIEYIISNIDDTKLKASLKTALFSAYEEDYGEQIDEPTSGALTEEPIMEAPPSYEPEVIEEPIIRDQELAPPELQNLTPGPKNNDDENG